MSFKFREELVGKRFLSVSGGLSKLKLNKISEWGWRAGVIRASSHRDNKHPELQVLVEYDDVEWQRREWLSLHKGRVFHAFLVEHSLVWAPRTSGSSAPLWPALTFAPLVDNAQLTDAPSQPIEFLGDLELTFRSDAKNLVKFQDWDNTPAKAVSDDAGIRAAVRRWAEFQNGQRIFLSTPSVLVGYRVEVYRAEGTTQWYTAVIVAYNEATSDLTVTDDTVLEEHNEDPRLVQMRLIGDGVVESIMRGENVGITPRRSRSAAAAANLALPPPCRSPRVTAAPAPSPGSRGNHTPPSSGSSSAGNSPGTTSSRPHRAASRTPEVAAPDKGEYCSSPTTKQAPASYSTRLNTKCKDRANNGSNNSTTTTSPATPTTTTTAISQHRIGTRRRKASGSCVPAQSVSPPQPREPPPPPPPVPAVSPPVKVQSPPKPEPLVIQQAISEKVIVNKSPPPVEKQSSISDEEEEVIEVARVHHPSEASKQCVVKLVNLHGAGNAPSSAGSQQQQQSSSRLVQSSDNVATTMLHHQQHQQQQSERPPHPASRLLDAASPSGATHTHPLPASSTDSGVGSLRSSSSSDERSASASSSSRSSETGSATGNPPPAPPAVQQPPSAATAAAAAAASSSLGAPSEPVRVWRDPTLVQASEPLVRHIHSVQHLSLMPQHLQQPGSNPPGERPPAPSVAAAAAAHRGGQSPYPPPPPPMLSPHMHSHLLPPPLYVAASQLPEMLWKQRYLTPNAAAQPGSAAAAVAAQHEEMRERQFARDREHQERFLRERREQEAREREREQRERERERAAAQQAHAERAERLAMDQQQERERLVMEQQQAERERLEKQRAEQAVHKHFEESLRLAQHKFPQRLGGSWNMLSTLPPPPSSRAEEEAHAQQQRKAHAQAHAQAAHAQAQREAHREREVQQQRLLLAERQRQEARDRAYYAGAPPPAAQPQPPPAQVPRKDFPPPPAAHSRVPSKHPHPSASPLPPPGEPKMPKVEATYNVYGYPAYQPMSILNTADKLGKELPTPPPLMSETKSSVIVKNESKSPAPSPKMYPQYPPRAPTPQNLANKRHLVSPPDNRQLLFPTGMPFATAGKGSAVAYPYTTAPIPNNPAIYGPPAAQLKPKVSSPAPPHIYGKPSAMCGPPPPSHHHPRENPSPLPLTSKAQFMTERTPPPAHTGSSSSSRQMELTRAMEHPRMYPQGPSAPPSPAPGATPSARASPLQIIPTPIQRPPPQSCQTQPLDLGLSSRESNSPKRSAPSPDLMRKRRPMEMAPQPTSAPPPAQLSRVSEPSPLIASAATTITTVENLAVSGSVIQRPSPQPVPVPTAPAPATKPASPPPKQTPTYQGHKLKKAWLQRHSGEDVTEQRCITPVTPSPSPAPGSPANRDPVPASPPAPAVTPTKGKGLATKTVNMVRKATASVVLPINGHADSPAAADSDSSSSDEKAAPAQRKSPAKRKPKVKRKKGAKKTEDKRRKVQSESVSESDKESGTEKDSEDSVCSTGTKKGAKESTGNTTTTTTNQVQGNGAKKRGRRPKSKNDEPRPPKKCRGGNEGDGSPTPPPRDPVKKPPVSQLKKTGESFLQDGYCFEVAPKLAKCRECRLTQNQRNKNMMNNIFCRFYYFRRLRYTKNGQLATAGFSDPYTDASEDDVRLWMPDVVPTDLDPEMARFLLTQVGDQFCDLIQQEQEAIDVNMAKDKKIVWKRVVQKVREMCDVCETTLFNFHWACDKCGFVVCIDCYKSRKAGSSNKVYGEPSKDKDDFSWLLCTNKQSHEQERLMLTQIIAGDALAALGRRMHEARTTWSINQNCGCFNNTPGGEQPPRANGICKELYRLNKSSGEVNGLSSSSDNSSGANSTTETKESNSAATSPTKEPGDKKNGGGKEEESPLSWLADVALAKNKPAAATSPPATVAATAQEAENSESESSDSEAGNFSTLRELLIRPSQKAGNNSSGVRSGSASPSSTTNSGAPVTSTTTANSPGSSPRKEGEEEETAEERKSKCVSELKYFQRRKKCRFMPKPLPKRTMTKAVSALNFPNTPHQWQCDGKLLVLQEPACPENYPMFQDHWKRGQPVMVLNVANRLQKELWHPDKFAKDFGDEKAELVNCMSGNCVPNTAMRLFWEGFENFGKRLKDKFGTPMLLKLKDWPPGEDFSDILPAHMADLMQALPLGEYTQRNGRLNIASRLPECFVRPDLGPKMYNAYGSALHPDKGTTNLHLDISDAVNVMVYAGSCKDLDNEDNMKAALRAVDEAGCDILTRRRVREKGVVPGALWHIYDARDADCIRDFLNRVAMERGEKLEPFHDPIHDQSVYLDGPLRERLYKDYSIEGYAIVQCMGDAIFVPAGAPHQVRNLHNCIKVAEDFVSPENVSHCFHLTQEFRDLSDTHTNHEDKLQIKNIMYHAVKDSLAVLAATPVSDLPPIVQPVTSATDSAEVKTEIKQEPLDDVADTVQSNSTMSEPSAGPQPPQSQQQASNNVASSSVSEGSEAQAVEVKKEPSSSPPAPSQPTSSSS